MAARNMQWMIGILASTLAACATTPSGVVPAGQDAYHVSVFGARYETQADTNLKAPARRQRILQPDGQGRHVSPVC